MTSRSYRRDVEAMGTRFEVFLHGDDEEHLEAVAVAVLEEVLRLDGLLSRFDPRSEIARINREAADQPVRVDRELFALLERCEQASQLTEGYFDVTASTGTKAVGKTPALHLDAGSRTVQFARPEISIDLGAIGKGYALDRGREILFRFGVGCALLEGGTSSVLALDAPDQNGWPVDVRHPLGPKGTTLARLALIDRGFSCSAARQPDWADQMPSDVLNPQTGEPIAGSAACLALAASATESEIFSTALLTMGRERAMRYLQDHPALDLEVGWFEPGDDFTWVKTRYD
jgi:thiamine biosynthesis lipoprotein